MMREMSIRSRILVGVILVNLAVAAGVAVHLHESFSRGLDVASDASIERAARAWEEISTHPAVSLDFATLAKNGPQILTRMKQNTGSDYGLLLTKSPAVRNAYASLCAQAGRTDDWTKNKTYVNAGATYPALASRMTITTPPEAMPESGRRVGIENGACSSLCHGTVRGSGDFWGVSWSPDANSRAYAVLPISDDAGRPLGIVYAVTDISSQANANRASLVSSMAVILIGLAVATIGVAFLLDVFVFKRLGRMITAMETTSARLVGCDFTASFEPDGTHDEIGKFEQFFADFLNVVATTLRSIYDQSA